MLRQLVQPLQGFSMDNLIENQRIGQAQTNRYRCDKGDEKGGIMADHVLFPPPSVIVFDIGNVLVTTDLGRFFARLKNLFPDDAEFAKAFQWLDKDDDRYELGLITTEELLQDVQAELGLDREKFVELWNNLFIERNYLLPFLKELREHGYALSVCSNTNELHVEYLLSTFSCFDLIDHFIFSYKVHAHKPTPTIYRAVEAVTGKPSYEHLFLDDLPENVEGARVMGWDAICFQDPRQVQEDLFMRGIRFTPWRLELGDSGGESNLSRNGQTHFAIGSINQLIDSTDVLTNLSLTKKWQALFLEE
jgi:putative hydrolase of the HAD superfamily